MAVNTGSSTELVDYRYFVTDLQTNELLAELPFRGVSYSRSLGEAGTFTGDLPVIDATYNYSIYENTLPGKTALYVVRNGVCVWGGIIWGRTYSLIDKITSITAAEFVSYLSHRVVWKTWSSDYEAEAVVADGTVTITLVNGQYGFEVGEAVYVNWGTEFALYNGMFSVKTATTNTDGKSVITADADYVDASGTANQPIPDMGGGEPRIVTVQTRQDTYEFARDLLTELQTDLFDFDFANDEIKPGIDLFNEISTISRSGNIATVTTTKKHELSPGQKIAVTDVSVDVTFNNPRAKALDIVSEYQFTYENNGNDISGTEIPVPATVINIKREGNIATFTTELDNPFQAGNIVYASNVSQTFDGYHTVKERLTPRQFTAVIIGSDISSSDTDTVTGSPRVTRQAAVMYGTFGEHTTLGDIGFDLIAQYQDDNSFRFSGVDEPNPTIRGFELKTVAEILEDYAAKPYGFEYRIDSEYDSDTKTFKNIFKFLPLVPKGVTDYIQSKGTGFTGAIPVTAYDRASQIMFEYPGNILEAQFEENAEEAATRFFVQGDDSQLGSAASQPYSGATNHKLLRQGWPLLDAVESYDSDDETVLWKHAQRLLSESVPPISTFTVSVNGSANPKLGTYSPGDWCTVRLNDDFVTLRAQSYLEQDYGDDSGVLVRKINAFEVSVPDTPSYPEQVQLELITEPSIPISGLTVVDGKSILEQ